MRDPRLLDYVHLDYWRWNQTEYQIINIIDTDDIGGKAYVIVSPEGLVKVTNDVYLEDDDDY